MPKTRAKSAKTVPEMRKPCVGHLLAILGQNPDQTATFGLSTFGRFWALVGAFRALVGAFGRVWALLGRFWALLGAFGRSSARNFGPSSTACLRTANQNQASFSPFGQREISVHNELTLGHLRYHLTDVPPQPNSPPV